MSPNPLEQLVNLRDQAHGAIKEQNLYTPANVKGGLITWPQAQETRVKVLSAVTARPPTATLKEAAMVSLMTLIPPDRVGVIRRLRLKHTLKRRESCWAVDLSKRSDGHKTSKHYGPFHGELPASLNGVLDSYANLLSLEPGGDEAYLFSPNDCLDRPLESSAWSAASATIVSPERVRSSVRRAPCSTASSILVRPDCERSSARRAPCSTASSILVRPSTSAPPASPPSIARPFRPRATA